jgi:hypothetical protein
MSNRRYEGNHQEELKQEESWSGDMKGRNIEMH